MDMTLPPCDIAFSSDPARRIHEAQFHQGFTLWTALVLTASDLSDLGTAISQSLSVVRFLFGIAIPLPQSRRGAPIRVCPWCGPIMKRQFLYHRAESATCKSVQARPSRLATSVLQRPFHYY